MSCEEPPSAPAARYFMGTCGTASTGTSKEASCRPKSKGKKANQERKSKARSIISASKTWRYCATLSTQFFVMRLKLGVPLRDFRGPQSSSRPLRSSQACFASSGVAGSASPRMLKGCSCVQTLVKDSKATSSPSLGTFLLRAQYIVVAAPDGRLLRNGAKIDET